MQVQASLVTELNGPWHTETIEIDEPHAFEVKVKMSYAGLCHSDEHLRTGDLVPDEAVVQILSGRSSIYPVIGGHEGAGRRRVRRRERHDGEARRPRRRVLRAVVRALRVLRLRPWLHLRPRSAHAAGPDDRRRHVAPPPRRRRPQSDVPARNLRRPRRRARGVGHSHRALVRPARGGADLLRDLDGLRVSCQSRWHETRRHRRRHRLRRCRLGRHPGRGARRGTRRDRDRFQSVEGRPGSQDRRYARLHHHARGRIRDPARADDGSRTATSRSSRPASSPASSSKRPARSPPRAASSSRRRWRRCPSRRWS